MMVEQKGNTVEEAIELALKKSGLPREKVKIEVIVEPKKGVFGLGAQSAIVRVTAVEEKFEQTASQPTEITPAKVELSKQKPRPGQDVPETSAEEKSPGIKFLQEVFKGLGIEAKFQALSTEDESQVIDIITPESALLIGKQGKNLDALQYLTNIAINRDADKRVRVLLDIEGYRARRKETLVALVKKVADEVRQTGRSVSLEPMNAYERRIVHLTLKEDPDIATESMGEGEERRVVIKNRKA